MNSQQKYDESGDVLPDWVRSATDFIPFPEKPAHYNNEKGSIYKFCADQELNPWEFDIIKRIVRCRKKGQFKEDLEKTQMAIDLYLKEYAGKQLEK